MPLYGPLTLLGFLSKVHYYDDKNTGPLLVLCRDGIGRTGTFIALDILIQQMATENVVDIEGCVWKLRNQRVNMVETKEQYLFLYEAVLEGTIVGRTSFPQRTYYQHVEVICFRYIDGKSLFIREFMVGRLLSLIILRCNLSVLEYLDVTFGCSSSYAPAGDSDRPQLSTPYREGNDYINAVYVDSFRKANRYIVTQMPMENTQVDFWRLVYDYKIKFIVMLNQLHERLSGPIMVKHYQLLDWNSNDPVPWDNGSFLQLIDIIQRTQELDTYRKNDKILIHCLNGDARSGLFCAVSFVVEQIRMNEDVDVFSAAKYILARRPQFIGNSETNVVFQRSVERSGASDGDGLAYLLEYSIVVPSVFLV
ncbi:hypothetical protein LSH36_1206g00046 [Paralvinella palmiformis]|uniref:protein-tyrosine-phosphatase n=1 Tax=Paralvinella palmiformis TaxID=53620 RepID=A0AAD9IV44_9ANNE|nr:hypothetical protein LSH36_1206g00046 [Paralvinella palmiformis]